MPSLRVVPNPKPEINHWITVTRDVPTWALIAIVRQRQGRIDRGLICLDGLTIDTLNGIVEWRGHPYPLRGRKLEVLCQLAIMRKSGIVNAPRLLVGRPIWRGYTDDTVGNHMVGNHMRTTVSYLRQAIPGLVLVNFQGTYRLNLTAEDAAWESPDTTAICLRLSDSARARAQARRA